MIDEARSGAGTAAYRGFLFSDMRGFTAFAERHGNAAAASAVSRFLDIARKAIARHDGAEIKTEGDAIHAVFPSASSAVLCGLDIVDGAAELNAREPERPLNLGVGVHAGEAVETAEGYIGRAVNIAARLCAAAQPGEVLVSSTVKGITQASIPVGFVSRGRRRLKGIEDPILVYAVHHAGKPAPPAQRPRSALLGAIGAGVVAVVVVAAIGASMLSGGGASPTPSTETGPSLPGAQPVALGPLGIGTYATQAFGPPMQFAIQELGWSVNRDQAQVFSLIREDAPEGSVYFMRVTEVAADPCIAGGADPQDSSPDRDVIARLFGLTHIRLSNLDPVEIGGATGRQVDVTIDEGVLAACTGTDVAVFAAGSEEWRAAAGERFRVIAITVRDQPVTIAISTDWVQTQSVQELENLFRAAQVVIDSVEFPG